MSDSTEGYFVSSKAMRRASITNNKEDASLEKKKARLRREFRAQELKLETAQKRLTLRKHSYEEERNKSIIDVPRQQNQNESAKDGQVSQLVRQSSLSALPPLQEQTRKKSGDESLSRLTIANLKFHNKSNNFKTRPQTDSMFPPVGYWMNPKLGSDSSLSSRSVSGISRAKSVSVPPAPTCQRSTTAKTTREEKLLNVNESAEKSLETRTGRSSVKFSSVNLRARIKFVTHMTRVLRRSREVNKEDNPESGPSNDISDIQRECEALENCRYLRKLHRKENEVERHNLAGEIKTNLVVKGL